MQQFGNLEQEHLGGHKNCLLRSDILPVSLYDAHCGPREDVGCFQKVVPVENRAHINNAEVFKCMGQRPQSRR